MRSYLDACGITRALDVVGERWAIPVIRELIFGPRRYSDLDTALPGVSTNILGARLKELVKAGVVVKRRLAPPTPANVYELTPWGAALEPVLIELGRWGSRTAVDLSHQALSASSLALSLKTTFDAHAAAGVELDAQLVMGEDCFGVHIGSGVLTIGRDAPHTGRASGLRLHADPPTMASYVYQGLEAAGTAFDVIRIEGSRGSAELFTRCFTLPEPPTKGTL
ncbi:winged helix-turn-helix transcriptional regulator [Ruania rhizosphaerae]|uniref:winged helix-turn-helix transcriptional regulator n=1 Tax=Ruania rhizosphaerae TaxID=1840413 RepID=UPI00135AD271|nr:helix-turn-helix domain-containing protein [Ruania rhizosphaerae]